MRSKSNDKYCKKKRRHTGKKHCGYRDRPECYVLEPRYPKGCWPPLEANWEAWSKCSSTASGNNQSYWQVNSGFLAFTTVRECTSVALSHQVCSIMLQQPQETNVPCPFRVVANRAPSPKPPTWSSWGLMKRLSQSLLKSKRESLLGTQFEADFLAIAPRTNFENVFPWVGWNTQVHYNWRTSLAG